MGTRRKIHLRAYHDEPDDFDMEINFGTYVLMFYYAKQISYEKAKLLYDTTLSEYQYRIDYDLPLGNLTYDDDGCHFDVGEFHRAIDFIENELIPELGNEKQDLLGKYGGKESFYDMFDKDSGFIEAEIYDEYYDSNPLNIAAVLDGLKNLLSNAILINKTYRVLIH